LINHHIRSFVRREGRMTGAQERALSTLWQRFGVDPTSSLLDLDTLFGRNAPRILEIGFGNGFCLATMAMQSPEKDFLGIEIYRPGVGQLLMQIEALDLTNLRLMRIDAVAVLEHHLPDAALDRVQIFFPDPWPKKRHHKRRLIQTAFTNLLARKIKPGGLLHLATDWEDYAIQMLAVLEATTGFRNTVENGGFSSRPAYRPLTKFERRAQHLGHNIWDLLFRRT
jgi:tRNA (guanine-N7-)-methyltransferase